MKGKKILSLVLSLVIMLGAVATPAFAENENINVTVKFDASVVAADMDMLYSDLKASYIIDEETTNLPSDITVTVPKGTTAKDVLSAAQAEAGFKTSGGMWIGYIEKKGTSFWGTGSPSEALQIAVKELEAAMNPLPENLLSELYVTTLFGTAEDNLIADFASDKYEYVIKDYTKDNFLPKFIKLKSVVASEDATVSVSLNGDSVSLSELTDGWKQFSNLDWENRVLNTLAFTVTPPEKSALEPTVYTVKIYSEITDAQKVSLAKKELTWDVIKGLNKNPAAITSSLALPSEIEIPDIGEVAVTWSGFDGVVLGEKGDLLSRPQDETPITLTATLTSGESSDTCNFELIILPPTEKEARDELISTLLKNIAETYTEKSSYWEVMDMGAYKKLAPETEAVLFDDASRAFVNAAIKAVAENNTDTELAKAILALTAQGKDATRLYMVNSNTPIDAVEKLSGTEHSTSVWSAPYTIAAYNRAEYKNRDKELSLVNALLASQGENGAWDEYGTIDTTANAIAGLAFYQNDKDDEIKTNVNRAIDEALSYLSLQQNADGSFSDSWSGRNSNSTAMVAIALSAAGVDVENDERFIKNGNCIIDGLLSFALEDSNGFGYTDNIIMSDYSTEQAFRALVAIAGAIKSDTAYNVYDFNGITLSPARATGEYMGGSTPSAPQGNNISVSLTIKADNGYWLNRYSVTLPGDGATVYHAFVKGCNENNLKYEGAENGYVSSISKGNKTLAEFDMGENSGWLYKLNGEAPLLGIRECNIKNGDSLELFYTKDYTKEPGIGGGLTASGTEEKAEQKPEEEKKPVTQPSKADFADVPDDAWYKSAVEFAIENNLFNGVSEKKFAPSASMTRAMLVTVLYRMANPEDGENAHSFADVPEGKWYSDAVAWAASNAIVSGISRTEFAPDGDITREQMAVIIYRFAKMQGYDVNDKADISDFNDTENISEWAYDALCWANKAELVTGTSKTTLSPKSGATRAEVATILMRFYENYKK